MKKKRIRIFFFLAAFTLLLTGCGSPRKTGEKQSDSADASEEMLAESTEEIGDDEVYYKGICYRRKDDIETILFIGVDKFEDQSRDSGYRNDQQADWIMMLILDKKSRTYQSLSINRDTMAQIPQLDIRGDYAGSYTGQLALAHTYGSGGKDSAVNMKKAVSDFLYNTPVDHYICLSMDAVETVNDLAGGVTLTVMDDMTSMDSALIEGAEITLTGYQALIYVRGRSGLDQPTNIHRMERQQQYLEALKGQLMDKWDQDSTFHTTVIRCLTESMTTNCTSSQLTKIAEACRDYEDLGNLQIEGESVEGEIYMEFYPDEEKLQELILDVFYQKVE